MNKSKEITTTHDIVKGILKKHPEARNSDNFLCYLVYAYIGNEKGVDIRKMSIPRFFIHMKEYGFPSTETIRRTRQKLQAEYPELAACGDVEAQRMLNEEVFKDYARKG